MAFTTSFPVKSLNTEPALVYSFLYSPSTELPVVKPFTYEPLGVGVPVL
jgi:hypothetical protein